MKEIALGSKVKDTVSGMTGIVVSRVTYLTGCVQYGVKPPMLEDGKNRSTEYIDEIQLKVVSVGVSKSIVPRVSAAKPPGGPSSHRPKE